MTKRNMQWVVALQTMGKKEYWNKPNTVEFFAFVAKAAIILPGLLFDISIWWFYNNICCKHRRI